MTLRFNHGAQRNPTPGGCWGVLRRHYGYCWKKARAEKLTCASHKLAESAAQRLKQKLRSKRHAKSNPPPRKAGI